MIEETTVCISTLVDKRYAPLVPVFKYCAEKAYPWCDTVVFARGDVNRSDVIRIDPDTYNKSPYAAAAMRFLVGERVLSEYDYVLITDVDVLMRAIDVSFRVQRIEHMRLNRLHCYDNCNHGNHMPGVHFVTRDWWAATRGAREKYMKILQSEDTPLDYDEKMLFNIVVDSGLPIPKDNGGVFNHGLHLGRFRDKGINAVRFQPGEFGFVESLINDLQFTELMANACAESQMVKQEWLCVTGLYYKKKA